MNLNSNLLKAQPKQSPATQVWIRLKVTKNDVRNGVNPEVLANGSSTRNRVGPEIGRTGKENPLRTHGGLDFAEDPMCVPQDKANTFVKGLMRYLQVIESADTFVEGPLHGRQVSCVRVCLAEEIQKVIGSVREKPTRLSIEESKPLSDTLGRHNKGIPLGDRQG